MNAGIVMVLTGSCGGFAVGIYVLKLSKKYSNCRVTRSTADWVSRSLFSLLTKRVSKSMIGTMPSGPTCMSTRLEEEAKCAEAACCCMHGVAYYFYATICLVLRGLDLFTVRARPCEVVEGFDEAFEDVRSLRRACLKMLRDS